MNTIDIERLVEHIEEKAGSIFGIEVKRLNIKHDLRGKVAGYCTYNKEYRFNAQIARDNEGYEQTVWHEVAHQISIQLYGDKGGGHGPEWKGIMRKLGRPTNRCHSYKNIKPGRRTRKFIVRCKCGVEHSIGIVGYNNARKYLERTGRPYYKCKCGYSLDITTAKEKVA